jgi:hypothetical protein
MPPEPPVTTQAPIAALPLEYANDALDPLVIVFRAVALLLLVLGICGFIGNGLQIVQSGSRILVGQNALFGWAVIARIPLSIVEIIAGAKNSRGTPSVKWIVAWIWATIAVQTVSELLFIWRETIMIVRSGDYFMMGLVVIYRLASVVQGCAFPLCVLILVICRRRLLALKPAR